MRSERTIPLRRLLERYQQLGALAEYADDVRRGEGRLVLVSGEAGVGKSSLLEAFEVTLTDARWAWGVCDGGFTPAPLGPLVDIAGELGGPLRQSHPAGLTVREDDVLRHGQSTSGR